jgi:HK97 gp10 family phage protein
MPVQWYGEQRQREIDSEMKRRISASVRIVLNRARKLVGVTGTKANKGKAKTYGAVRSLPGEPPRKQTGQLRRSISTEVYGLVGRVGPSMEDGLYPKYLELGTRHMQPRPWLRRALDESRAAITAILGKPIR